MTTMPIDLDALTMADVRAGAFDGRPVTVLGLARSGIALARFLADAGARVTVYDGRPAGDLAVAIARPGRSRRRPAARAGRRPGVHLGGGGARRDLAVDHARLPDDRAPPAIPAPGARRAAGRGRRLRARARRRGGPVPAPLPGADDRGHRDQGQDDHVVAGPRDPVGRPGSPRGPRRQHRHAADRAPARAHARPPRGHRAVGAPAAGAVARHDRRRVHERDLGPPRPPRLDRGVPAGQAPPRGARGPGRGARAQRRGPGGGRVRGSRDGTRRPVSGRQPRSRAASACSTSWIVAAGVERLPLAGGGTAATAPGGGIMPVDELAIPGRHNVSNALAAIAVGLLFGVAPEAIRRAAAAFTGVEHRLQPVALVDGVRFVNDSQGTQPDAVIAALRAFPAPVVLIAGGRDKGVDLTELAAGRGGDGRGRGADRRERPGARGAAPRRRRAAGRPRRHPRGRRRDRRRVRPRRPRRPGPPGPSPRSCSARPPPRSTCSRTTPPAAARSSRPSAAWRRHDEHDAR